MKIGFRVWILIIAILLSLLAIGPSLKSGAVVSSVSEGSQIYIEGIRSGEIIKSVNNFEISSGEEYANRIGELMDDGIEKRIDIETDAGTYVLFTNKTPEIIVGDVPKTKIKTGLDLRGGSRALVKADVDLSESQLQDLVEVSRNRFNVYGLSDVQIKGVSDFEGNRFMLVEVAGASPDDLQTLIGQQGKFEARIGNQTVFTGGEDINDVCRNDASCAAVIGCSEISEGWACNFAFTIFLSSNAARKHADITREIPLDPSGQYLQESLFLYVDDSEVDSLLISANLKGQLTSEISIQGSGQGSTRDLALEDARSRMNELQTILITGSLPYKLEIVKLDSISPTLGGNFIYLLLLAGSSAIVVVSIIVFFRYRRLKASLALLITSFSELLIILGFASLIGWNLDLPSIAGILATIGTGVDQQIVILDEASKRAGIGIKQRMKRALFVIMTAYLTSVFALIPLWWAGAGLFKGFAFTTILGITAGVLITRPAFAQIIGRMEKD
jgi:preprotein translocase subunit SecD